MKGKKLPRRPDAVLIMLYGKTLKSFLAEAVSGRVKGSGESIGLPLLKPGRRIETQGLGSLWSRTYYLEKTTHTIGASGYKTTFTGREQEV
jgi:uncharacterized protein